MNTATRPLLGLLSTIFLMSCSDPPAPKTPGETTPVGTSAARPPAPAPKLPGPPALPSVVVAEMANPERPIHFARNGERGLIVAHHEGKLLGGPLEVAEGADASSSEPTMVEIAKADDEGPMRVVPHQQGFLLAWSEGSRIRALAVSESGKPQGEPADVGTFTGAIQWVDVIGEHVVWQASKGGASRLTVKRWPDGPALVVADGVQAWHAVPADDGLAVAWVDGEPGTVRGVELGTKRGKVLELGVGAIADVQLAAVGDEYVAAWTDARTPESHVRFSVFGGGKIRRASDDLAPPVGSQRLVSLVGAEDGRQALVAWEQELSRRGPRRIHLGLLSRELGPVHAQASLAFHGSGSAPHIVADRGGFTALTLAPMMVEGAVGAAGAPLPVGPVFVRLAADLTIRNAEPIRVLPFAETGGVPSSVRSLECADGRCSVLAQGGDDPSLLVLASLPVRKTPWHAPIFAEQREAVPRASALDTIAESTAPISDLDAVKLHDGRTLLGWVTYSPGAPGTAPATATLAIRFVETDGRLGEVQVISQRAISVGGVQLAALPAPDGPKDPVAVIGWSGPSKDVAQVFLSSIDAAGATVRQKTVTRHGRPRKNEPAAGVYDVDVLPTTKEHLVVWADTRHGNPEIYAARVDHQLARRGKEERLTESAEPSLEPRLVRAGDQALIAWTDPQGRGHADVWIATLDTGNLDLGSPIRLDDAPEHARTPSWAGDGAGSLALSWVDEPTDGGEPKLRLVSLGPKGRTTSAIRSVRLPQARVGSAGVRCDERRCRGVLTAKREGTLVLGAFEAPLEHGAPVIAEELVELPGGTSQDLALTVLPGGSPALFFQDHAGGAIVRRLRLSWP